LLPCPTAKAFLMAITGDPTVCVWNILKYALRGWNGKAKEHDLEKIAYYAQLGLSLSNSRTTANST
jgi:hypothetical protein